MNVKKSYFFGGLIAALAGLTLGTAATAAPVPAKVEMTSLRCIQNYGLSSKDGDQVYLTVTGVAKGAELNSRLPETGTLAANKKKPPVTAKAPVTLWEGELADGEFALVTVGVYQGTGDDAAKAFAASLAEAEKGVAERAKKTLTADEGKKLMADTVAAERGVVENVKETLSREKNTDHFGGLFNILVWNNNGTLVKRLDPVGLTFGEHFGIDEKIYTKIKYTRNNVLVAEGEGEDAEYYPQQFPPISEDKQTIRAKMLETEYFTKDNGRRSKNVTDYLADIRILSGDKPLEWKLGGEHIGPSQLHMWWEWAD